jgi:nitroreductase
MELSEVIRRRRMYRNFTDRSVDPSVVDTLLDQARRAPSAGHTQGWAWLALEGPEQTRRFWEADADPAWLAAPDHPGLLRAPVILVPWTNPAAYDARYDEEDKARQGRPGGVTGRTGPNWPVPWWDVDLAFAVMIVLLGATDLGLGALFFALHRDPARLAGAFGVPPEWRPLGAIALGWPVAGDPLSPSAGRGRRPADEVVHRGGW